MSDTDYRFDGLEDWEKKLSQFIESRYPAEFREMVIELAVQLQDEVKRNTPVDTGHLKDEWHVGQIVKRGNEYYIEVYNNVEYAEAVEYGHRKRRKGAKTKSVEAAGDERTSRKDFVPGAHMMELSMQKIQRQLPDYLREWLNDFLNEHEL